MPIPISCPMCGNKLRVPDSAAGKRIKCPRCKEVIAVPAPTAPEEVEALEPERPTRPAARPPARPAAPPRKRAKIPTIVYALGVPLGLIILCCGCMGWGWWGTSAATAALKDADRKYAAGKVDEAVAVYKDQFAYANDKQIVLKRIVDYDAQKGDGQDMAKWVKEGFEDKIEPNYDAPAAQQALAALKNERDDRVAQEKADQLAREAKRREEEATRKAAADAKTNAQAAQEIQAQVDRLQSRDWQTCADAADALGWMGPKGKDAVPALLAAFGRTAILQDGEEAPIGGRCLAAVEKIGPAALPAITDAVQRSGNPGLRSALVDVLKQWGPSAKDAAPVLAGLTAEPPGNDDDPLCYYAADALSAVDPDNPWLVPALVQALGYNSLTRATAVDDLAAIGPRAKPALPALKQVAAGALPLKRPPVPQQPLDPSIGPLRGGSEEGSLKKSQQRAADLVRNLGG